MGLKKRYIRNRQSGFSLLELLIAIAILAIIMAMNSTLLQEMIRGKTQQGAIVASQFETSLGLEILRNDLGNAGFGLPDQFEMGIVYTEIAGNPGLQFNDAPSNVPRALAHSNDISAIAPYASTGYLANSDYIVIKSPAVGMNKASGKWTYIDSVAADYVQIWNDPSLDMENNDYMVVIRARSSATDLARLEVVSDASGIRYAPQYNGSTLGAADQGFRPPMPPTGDRYIAYGVDKTDPAMPFNRTDYYVRRTATNTSAGCAPNTGTFFKAVANQSGDGEFTTYPIVDCVANMQVVFGLDQNPTDSVTVDTWKNTLTDSDDATPLTALQIKERVKEIRVYILAHEGSYDRGFRYSGGNTIIVGRDVATGRNVDLTAFQDAGHPWDRYRWKIYTISVKPRSFY